MELELKHLAPYLPYNLETFIIGEFIDEYADNPIPKGFNIEGLNTGWVEIHEIGRTVTEQYPFEDVKPILRPLSDLTKEIEHNGEDFVPYEHHVFIEAMAANEYLEYLCEARADLSEDRLLPYSIVQLLLEWHFDVFGLIEKGLAIDKTSL